MTLPSLTDAGDLPLGVHRASLREIVGRFGSGSPQRKTLALRLERVLELANGTGHLRRFVVFGSFVTDKRDPNDIDVFLLMDNAFVPTTLDGERRLLFDHAAAQSHLGASVFWLTQAGAMEGEQAAVEYWQVKRGEGRRGIVEVALESP